MSRLPTVKIANLFGGDGYVIVNRSAFDPAVHTLWEDRDAQADAPVLPDGYEAKHRGGGKYVALVDGQPLKAGESNEPALFDDKAAALNALAQYAEAQQAEDGDD